MADDIRPRRRKWRALFYRTGNLEEQSKQDTRVAQQLGRDSGVIMATVWINGAEAGVFDKRIKATAKLCGKIEDIRLDDVDRNSCRLRSIAQALDRSRGEINSRYVVVVSCQPQRFMTETTSWNKDTGMCRKLRFLDDPHQGGCRRRLVPRRSTCCVDRFPEFDVGYVHCVSGFVFVY